MIDVDKFVKNNSPSPISPIRDVLKTKDAMRTVEHYLCDRCDQVIADPLQGFVVHGNIYVADPKCRGGLIGNNFPDVAPGDKIEVTDVKERVLCINCFKEALDLKSLGHFHNNPRKNLNVFNKAKQQKISDR